MANINDFLKELRRRNVFKVGVAYIIVAWLIIQVVDIIFPALNLPEWTITFVTLLILIGFPIIVLFAWAFELTPEGVKFTKEVDPTESITSTTGKKFNTAIITLLLLAVVYMAIDNYVLVEETPAPVIVETTTPEVAPAETRVTSTKVAEETEDKKSVAVLPFANRSEEKKDSFFVDGMHDDILTQLAKISSLKVISRTSVMGYRDTTKKIKAIGKELGVKTILEGGIQRAGNRVRINMQLIDTDTDEHLWAETYNRELTAENIFEIQEQIATEIAAALRATLSPEEQERIKAVPTKNLAALEAYFHGRQHLVNRTSEGLAKAVEYFQQAITLDPDFALAYVGLSDTYQLQAGYSGLPVEEMNAKAEVAITRALALDDKLGEAYASLGLLKQADDDLEGAETAFKNALSLNPNYSSIYIWYGSLKNRQDKFEDALAIFQQGAELDPRSVVLNINIAFAFSNLGRFDEQLVQQDKVIELAPTSALGYFGKGYYYWFAASQLDEAARWLHRAYSIDTKNPRIQANLAMLYIDLGDDEQASCWANRAVEMASESFFPNLTMLMFHIVHGEETQALTYAQKGVMIQPRNGYPVSLAMLRNHDMQTGNYQGARKHYEKHYPELLSNEPNIGIENFRAAIDLAAILQKTGEQEQADKLLDKSLQYMEGIQRLGINGYGTFDVHAHALRGDTQNALGALRQAIDSGWRWFWQFEIVVNPNIDSIRNEPEYQAMIAEIKADMAEQSARVKTMELAGGACINP